MDQAHVDENVRKDEGGFWETIKVILQALLIAVVVRTLLVPALQHSVRLARSRPC